MLGIIFTVFMLFAMPAFAGGVFIGHDSSNETLVLSNDYHAVPIFILQDDSQVGKPVEVSIARHLNGCSNSDVVQYLTYNGREFVWVDTMVSIETVFDVKWFNLMWDSEIWTDFKGSNNDVCLEYDLTICLKYSIFDNVCGSRHIKVMKDGCGDALMEPVISALTFETVGKTIKYMPKTTCGDVLHNCIIDSKPPFVSGIDYNDDTITLRFKPMFAGSVSDTVSLVCDEGVFDLKLSYTAIRFPGYIEKHLAEWELWNGPFLAGIAYKIPIDVNTAKNIVVDVQVASAYSISNLRIALCPCGNEIDTRELFFATTGWYGSCYCDTSRSLTRQIRRLLSPGCWSLLIFNANPEVTYNAPSSVVWRFK